MSRPLPPASLKLPLLFKHALIVPVMCSLFGGCAATSESQAPSDSEGTLEASAEVTSPVTSSAEASKFAGTWVLNAELSSSDALGLKRRPATLSVVETSTGFEVVERQQGENLSGVGDPNPIHVHQKSFTFDGFPTFNGPQDYAASTTITLISRTADRIVLENKMNVSSFPATSVVWELMPDGRLSITETSKEGRQYSKEVFDRAGV